MERKCSDCNGEMSKAILSGNGYATVEKFKDVFKGKSNPEVSGLITYVCSKCGYIDLFAKDPEIFEKQS